VGREVVDGQDAERHIAFHGTAKEKEEKMKAWVLRPIAYASYFGLGLSCLGYSAWHWNDPDWFLSLMALFAGMFFVCDSIRKGAK